MRNDVKTLIGALTTERNSIDRAIQALSAMSEPKAEAKPLARVGARKARRRIRMTDELKVAIAVRMNAANGSLANAARELADEYGANFSTIYTSWQRWLPSSNPEHVEVMTYEPEAVAV